MKKKISTISDFVEEAILFAKQNLINFKSYSGDYVEYLTDLAKSKKLNFDFSDFYVYTKWNEHYTISSFFEKYLKTHKKVTEKFDEISRLPTPEEKVVLNELNHRFIELLGRKVSQNYYLLGEEDLIDLYFREGKELEEPIEFSFKSVEDAAKYVCVLEGSRNQKLFPDIVSGPRGAYKSEGVSIFFDSNAQAALKSLLDQGYNIEPDTRGGQSFKIVEDKHTIDNIVKKYKLTLFDKSTYSGDISDYIDRHTKIDSKTGVHTVHNSVKDLLKYGHANRRDNYQNKYNNQDYWENDMNIYEQLNKINDTESLSEKYNVKNAKELKKLQESSTVTLRRGREETLENFMNYINTRATELGFDINPATEANILTNQRRNIHLSWNYFDGNPQILLNITLGRKGYRVSAALGEQWIYSIDPNDFNPPEKSQEEVYEIIDELLASQHHTNFEESLEKVRIPTPWNKYLEVDNYTPEEGEYLIGDKIGEYTLVAYLAPKSAYEDKFDGWPMLFKDSSNNYVVGETSHDRVYPWDIDDYALTESSNGKQDVRHEAQRIHDELIKKGYTYEEIKSIFSILHTAAINNFEPARPKLKAAFPDLDI